VVQVVTDFSRGHHGTVEFAPRVFPFHSLYHAALTLFPSVLYLELCLAKSLIVGCRGVQDEYVSDIAGCPAVAARATPPPSAHDLYVTLPYFGPVVANLLVCEVVPMIFRWRWLLVLRSLLDALPKVGHSAGRRIKS
jgi:hypothetical protein